MGGQQPIPAMGRQQSTPIMGGQQAPNMGGKAFLPLGMTVLPAGSTSRTGLSNAMAAQRRIQQTKPFAAAVLCDWYNLELKNSNKYIYNKLNGCYKPVQSNDFQSWLIYYFE